MNERIKELAEQSRKHARDYVAECKHYGYYMEHNEYGLRFEEKFAELIVRECLSHGKLTQSQTVVNGSEEYNAGREMGIEVFMNRIKQHFGVEE